MTENVNHGAQQSAPVTPEDLIDQWRDSDGPEGGVIAMLDAAHAELATRQATIEDLHKQLAKANRTPRVARGTVPAKPRNFAKLRADASCGEELLAKIAAADTVEVVLCSGATGREITEIAPFRVAGDCWRLTGHGVMLTEPIEVAVAGQSIAVSSYGLVIDGEVAGYRQRINGQLTIAAGMRTRIADDVVF